MTAQESSASEMQLPTYGAGWLGAVLAGVARTLDVDLGLPAVELPAAQRICVVLIDGLGEQQLAGHPRSARFLTRCGRRVLHAGLPSTTATSMGSFGTGLPPGRHGLAGYIVRDPDRDVLFNELKWDDEVEPIRWQSEPTIFERLAAVGIRSLAIGNPEFEGSGLTVAAHRGSTFLGANRLHQRVDAALAALADPDGPSVVYLYWGQVDAAGHHHGVASAPWRKALHQVDAQLERLARKAPAGTLLLVTADHGMIDAAATDRIDLADHPELTYGVRLIGGEPRFLQLYCEPAAGDDVAIKLAGQLGDKALVLTRDAADAAGWFGGLTPRVAQRFGDVIVAAKGAFTLVDSRSMTKSELGLIGYHGSVTPAEQQIPLVVELL